MEQDKAVNLVNINGREWEENLQDRTLVVPDKDWVFQVSPEGHLMLARGKTCYEKQFQDFDTAMKVADLLISILSGV